MKNLLNSAFLTMMIMLIILSNEYAFATANIDTKPVSEILAMEPCIKRLGQDQARVGIIGRVLV